MSGLEINGDAQKKRKKKKKPVMVMVVSGKSSLELMGSVAEWVLHVQNHLSVQRSDPHFI
jgi:hypothetical protein